MLSVLDLNLQMRVLGPEFLQLSIELHEVLGVILTVGNERQFQIIVFLFKLIFSLVYSFEFFSQSDLYRVALCESDQFLHG